MLVHFVLFLLCCRVVQCAEQPKVWVQFMTSVRQSLRWNCDGTKPTSHARQLVSTQFEIFLNDCLYIPEHNKQPCYNACSDDNDDDEADLDCSITSWFR